VTEEEFAGLEARGFGRGVNLGEWVREELLERPTPERLSATKPCSP